MQVTLPWPCTMSLFRIGSIKNLCKMHCDTYCHPPICKCSSVLTEKRHQGVLRTGILVLYGLNDWRNHRDFLALLVMCQNSYPMLSSPSSRPSTGAGCKCERKIPLRRWVSLSQWGTESSCGDFSLAQEGV